MAGFTGVTTIDCRTRSATVTVVAPFNPPNVALMVEVPALRAVIPPVVVTETTPPMVEDQVALLVRSWIVPSL